VIEGILALSFLIFFHELGHYLVARKVGVKVEVFSIGLGKPLKCVEKWGTRWCLAPIPLGGYVKMKGEEEWQRRDPDSYYGVSPLKRIAILLGGPLFNLLLAYLIYYGIALTGIKYLAPVVGKIFPGSPAEKVLKPGDKIVEVNHHKVTKWDDLSPIISKSEKVELIILRNGQKVRVTLKPTIKEMKNIFGETIKRRIIGIAPAPVYITIKYNPIEAFGVAWEQFKKASLFIWKGIEKLITGAIGLNNLSGPIGIVDASAKVWQAGIVPFLLFTALLSVNLGILNLFPIPVLDGGQILFQLYELLTGRELNERVASALTYLGIAFLVIIMGIGIFNDISRLAGGG